ncbi:MULTISPECIES: respiratory nitrate reductase subunit gamma [Loigolactobacillus]|uniref:Nitrate reductase n=1 Tax=Loigolactobacillus backii TaxID=375175 RepID=A0A192H5N9_9LACO|nr:MULTISPECIES: respiratory nitrate reductase subunit gamma [Loigolactobacillus]ANK63527.1 nitrate reductase [Loigolactobacillus backii]ANK70853.1 nitrate reductase [Loigolactobacillus backii]MDA5386720.1 respiratory nitrate reductase subunit gamma [Loigolactobacillus backii]MDA5389245.1 respiratory nitrate reductase subunit gamma [Loigolactobacillus backii]
MAHPFQFLLWTFYPYLMLGSFFFGTIIRFAFFHPTVTAKSSEILEKKTLMIGSILFHVGIIGVFFGHIAGIFIPKAWTDALGISNEMYHMFALGAGGVFGIMATVGVYVLCFRRYHNHRVFHASSIGDLVIITALTIEITLGMSSSFIAGPMNPSFNYRTSLAIWVRQLFMFHPDFRLMLNVPLLYKCHVVFGLMIFGAFPYTRLVHALALPWQYIFRRFIVYRKKPQI